MTWQHGNSTFGNTLPQVTAVVLNWSRFQNVLLIASLLCSPALDGTIARDFARTGCASPKLQLHNSDSNLYFQARFIACAEATTEYCFIQDDDYLVRPEVINAMYQRLSSSPLTHPGGIHILPPHEYLSSTLRTLVAGHNPATNAYNIHTTFAWLGHGALVRRSMTAEFLQLLTLLNASDEERKRADNYYTILGNRIPEIWLDQSIELGGGQPFTVGTDGHERNLKHITKATRYLDAVVGCGTPPCIFTNISMVPYMDLTPSSLPATQNTLAAYAGMPWTLETNIGLLPFGPQVARAAEDMLLLETRSLDALGPEARARYVTHPLSHIADGNADTCFESVHGAGRIVRPSYVLP
ncbi:hypothetical protein PUNSTDRAFT_56387 [Punctularia strigosozonata HHB-11173 SS5]|uniref:uncharacterized protein n=1 Tax=Punctularia strigosozonata (strain HHB-11173) TaxID=741275 RepID=UPI0004417AF6|nr:uncharacterized protein PUNSTDRAFT_56387 [Punctularia strigosozonata HHB-11173 SS5]EIN13887.1 hypothetical protein PUNSTDRAFT_56387 [Punctularia strigosozonata HHB-11173 SS5]